jgi:hypothetical protein
MAELFGVNVPAVSKHLKNIFETGELDQSPTVSILEIVQNKLHWAITRQTAADYTTKVDSSYGNTTHHLHCLRCA